MTLLKELFRVDRIKPRNILVVAAAAAAVVVVVVVVVVVRTRFLSNITI